MTFLNSQSRGFKRLNAAACAALLLVAALLMAPVVSAQSQLSTTLDAPVNRSAAGPVGDGKAVPAQPVPINAATASAPPSAANPYGLSALWLQGDWVAKGCLLLLALMSVASWYALLGKVLLLRRLRKQTQGVEGVFKNVRHFAAHMASLRPDNPHRYVADAGSLAVHQYAALKPRVDYDTWLVRAIEQALSTLQTRMQGGMALLATVGSTAPFVGLFGTVWAIYTALVKIGASGQASIDRVAGPVGEALIMTAIGLAVAVPAVFGYNWLLRQNKLAFEGVRNFGAQLHSLLLATTDLTSPAPESAPPTFDDGVSAITPVAND
jgi:biopolymer transport protein ExbB